MPEPRYRLSRAAADDLVSIFVEGIRLFGPRQAAAYRDDLAMCFSRLAEQPRMARERPEFVPPIRAHLHRSHVVVYVEQAGEILIIRLFHRRQEWSRLL